MDKSLLAKLIIAAVLLSAVLWLLGNGNLMTVVQLIIELLRSAGPITFFVAMALLPAIGAPLSFFTLTAGPVFGPALGMPLVMLGSLVAIATNIALGHVLARRVLGPLLSRVLQSLGYRLPQVDADDVSDLTVLVRVTPGIPFPVQHYLLGLAGVPFGRYLVVSCLIAFPLNVAIIIFGEALMQGRGRAALVGLLVLLALMAAVNLLRRRYTKAKASVSRPEAAIAPPQVPGAGEID
jgi:uncharacterized membrane protein YdjX (TVP38/TMEM64 family)